MDIEAIKAQADAIAASLRTKIDAQAEELAALKRAETVRIGENEHCARGRVGREAGRSRRPLSMSADLPHMPEPYATSVTWRYGESSWQQWHDSEDPMPAEWDDEPPDEVVHVYTADQMRAYAYAYAAAAIEAAAALITANAEQCEGMTREILVSRAGAVRALKGTT